MTGGGRVCGKAGLQLWCRLELASYPGLEVTNMSSDWRSGRAFCALIHRFRPDTLDWSRVSAEEDPEHWRRNCELAFNTASEKLGIPALLDAEDIVRFEDPDPLSIMTYLSLVYHAFTSTSGRRARSVSRSRARAGAMDRLMDEARRARSVSSARSGEIRQPAAERAASPPLEMENPFKLLGAETEPEIKQTRESLVTRRSKRRSQEPQMRVRSLFIDNLDRELPTLMEDTRDTRPRHVLSYSSYAMPYRSTGCLASSSMVEGLESLGSEVSLESEVRAGHSRRSSKSKAIVSFVKSKLGRLNSNSEKRKSSQNFFESKLHASENIKHTIS